MDTCIYDKAESDQTGVLMPSKMMQENLGLAKIHAICSAMDAIWRPTISGDVGIDGQIEFLEPSSVVSTGYVLAVQVKSGPSYFVHESEQLFRFYPEERHRRYWARHILPVILILHDPTTDRTLYTRVKPQLANGGAISVLKRDIFVPEARDELLAVMKADRLTVGAGAVLESFRSAIYVLESDKTITGIEFLLACVDADARAFKFNMARLCAMLSVIEGTSGVMIGAEFYNFILRLVIKCWSFQLTESFEKDFEFEWYDLQMVPEIEVALTPQGMDVAGELLADVGEHLAHEGSVSPTSDGRRRLAQTIIAAAQEAHRRLDDSDRPSGVPR